MLMIQKFIHYSETRKLEGDEEEDIVYNHPNMKSFSDIQKREYGMFSYLWYYLTASRMYGPYNVSHMRG